VPSWRPQSGAHKSSSSNKQRQQKMLALMLRRESG
jgi:hypothetical protein